ncbi:MAG: SAM-dependent chlorinase/fluorinase [Bacteroidales bacterium]
MITVTLTTDWGGDGLYSGAFKGRLVHCVPGIQLIDITHSVDALNPAMAVYALHNGYSFFADNTIHVVGVGGNVGNEHVLESREFICFEYNKHYFIGPNNGMWEMLFGEVPEEVYVLDYTPQYTSFPELNIYVEAILQLSLGKHPYEIGHLGTCKLGRLISLPARKSNELLGIFQYFDVYGNGITNISQEEFYDAAQGRSFSIIVGSDRAQFVTDFIAQDYSEGDPSKILALFSFTGFLEICVPSSQLTKFLHIEKNTKILVRFFDGSEDVKIENGKLF